MELAEVLRTIDATMFMRGADWLQEALASSRDLVVLDLRAEAAFARGHLAGSVRVGISELPDRLDLVGPSPREVVCVCNGSVQSAMAVVFLRTQGYTAFNLSGGVSSWERQGRPLVSSTYP